MDHLGLRVGKRQPAATGHPGPRRGVPGTHAAPAPHALGCVRKRTYKLHCFADSCSFPHPALSCPALRAAPSHTPLLAEAHHHVHKAAVVLQALHRTALQGERRTGRAGVGRLGLCSAAWLARRIYYRVTCGQCAPRWHGVGSGVTALQPCSPPCAPREYEPSTPTVCPWPTAASRQPLFPVVFCTPCRSLQLPTLRPLHPSPPGCLPQPAQPPHLGLLLLLLLGHLGGLAAHLTGTSKGAVHLTCEAAIRQGTGAGAQATRRQAASGVSGRQGSTAARQRESSPRWGHRAGAALLRDPVAACPCSPLPSLLRVEQRQAAHAERLLMPRPSAAGDYWSATDPQHEARGRTGCATVMPLLQSAER